VEEIQNVRKFDGSVEPFSPDKVMKSILNAGGSESTARELLEQLIPKLKDRTHGGVISTLCVKEEVGDLLKARDPDLAKAYLEFKTSTKAFST